MYEEKSLNDLKNFIDTHQTFALFGHQYIDGDCIGSCLAMKEILEKLGKSVEIFTPITPSASYHFIEGVEKIATTFLYKKYDAIMFLDFTPYIRIDGFTKDKEQYFNNTFKIIIDHHIDEKLRGNINIIDTTGSSTCELLYEIIMKLWPDLMNEKIATYLMLGLITDTGNMTYEKDSIRTTTIALELLKHGAQKKFLIDNLFNKKPLGAFQFLGTLVNRLKIENNIVYTYYDENETSGIEREYIDSMASQFQSIKEAQIFLLLRRVGNMIKGSLRAKSSNQYNVEKIAKECFGGGGHRKAAGFSFVPTDNLEKDVKYIVDKVKNFL